jgi:hypothetical protein
MELKFPTPASPSKLREKQISEVREAVYREV